MIDIEPGSTYQKTFLVNDEHTISARVNDQLPQVLATFVLVEWMEVFAAMSAQPFVPEGHLTLGTRIDIEHMGAALMGFEVLITLKVDAVDSDGVTFAIEAFCHDRLIAKATHRRRLIHLERLAMALTKRFAI